MFFGFFEAEKKNQNKEDDDEPIRHILENRAGSYDQSIMRILRKRDDGSSSIVVVASGMPAIDYGQVDQRRSPIAGIIAAIASLRRRQLSVSEKLRICFRNAIE